jgi:hypothetical protein
MRARPSPPLGDQRVRDRSEMSRPHVDGQALEVGQRCGLVEQELGQTSMSLPQIAGGTGGHYVAAGLVAAAHLRLHMIKRELGADVLHAAVHTAPVIAEKAFVARHDG